MRLTLPFSRSRLSSRFLATRGLRRFPISLSPCESPRARRRASATPTWQTPQMEASFALRTPLAIHSPTKSNSGTRTALRSFGSRCRRFRRAQSSRCTTAALLWTRLSPAGPGRRTTSASGTWPRQAALFPIPSTALTRSRSAPPLRRSRLRQTASSGRAA